MMNPILKSLFTSDQLNLAAVIGGQTIELRDKILALFQDLDDPLLSVDDVTQLLGTSAEVEDVRSAMDKLVDEGELERSSTTHRAFDADGVRLYRSARISFQRLRLTAIEADLGDGARRYQFTCDGRLIRSIARIDRLDAIAGTGQQREEIRNHVDRIAEGIRGGNQIPNSILLVLSDNLVADDDSDDAPPSSFIVVHGVTDQVSIAIPGGRAVQTFRTVELDLPFRRAAFDEEKAAVLVDGQQRTAALSMVDIDEVPAFALSVNAVVASNDEAKKIFQIANTTQKIQTQFSRALLASMDDAPGYLKNERVMALAAKLLAVSDAESPFYELVQYPGVKARRLVAYNSLFHVISIFAGSALPLDGNAEALALTVKRAFNLVKREWPDAWGKKPTQSRLMHGVGLRAIASVLVGKLESLVEQYGDLDNAEMWAELEQSISRLRQRIVWTDAEAATASIAVSKIFREEIAGRQNTNQDITAVTSFLKKESLDLDSKARKARKGKA
ncbi:DGQHR domain-containing protein [Nannocystaceae bacterium ST9]